MGLARKLIANLNFVGKAFPCMYNYTSIVSINFVTALKPRAICYTMQLQQVEEPEKPLNKKLILKAIKIATNLKMPFEEANSRLLLGKCYPRIL